MILSMSRHVYDLKKLKEEEEAQKQEEVQQAALSLLQSATSLAKQNLKESDSEVSEEKISEREIKNDNRLEI